MSDDSTFGFMGGLGGGEIMLIVGVISLIGVVHFLPSIIGFRRPDRLLIFLVNLLAGWSIIGWFAALYLALRKETLSNPFSTSSVADELAKLRDLRDQGILTQVEFEHQKNNLIS